MTSGRAGTGGSPLGKKLQHQRGAARAALSIREQDGNSGNRTQAGAQAYAEVIGGDDFQVVGPESAPGLLAEGARQRLALRQRRLRATFPGAHGDRHPDGRPRGLRKQAARPHDVG